MKINLLTFVFLFLLCFTACKEETSSDGDQLSTEDAYFQDYESPDKKWGFLDLKGKKIVPAKFDDVRDMVSDLTAVNYEGRWGFIDKVGSEKIPFKYKQVLDFNGYYTFVEDFDSNWLLIDQTHKVIDTLAFDNYQTFTKVYCAVANNNRWGLIDSSGQVKIPTKYELLKITDDNACIVKSAGKYGLVSYDDEIIKDFEYKRIKVLTDSEWLLFRNDIGYFYENLRTKVKSKTFEKASDIQDGLVIVRVNKQYSLFDLNTQKISKSFDYDKLEVGGEGFWKYKQNGKWGILDREGNVLTEAKFDMLNQYHENFMVFGVDDMWGYLDNTGKVLINARFPLAWDFKNGLARIFTDKGIGYMNKEGKLILVTNSYEARDFHNGLARFQES